MDKYISRADRLKLGRTKDLGHNETARCGLERLLALRVQVFLRRPAQDTSPLRKGRTG